MLMMTVTAAAEEVENNLKKHSDVGGVCIVGNVEELEDEKMMDECREFCEEEEGTGRPGADPNTRHKVVQIDVMDSVKFVQARTTDPAKLVQTGGVEPVESKQTFVTNSAKEDVGHRDGSAKFVQISVTD